MCGKFIILCPTFCSHTVSDLTRQLLIKSRGNADRLRKYRGDACPGDTMQSLSPPVVSRNPQSFDRRGVILKLSDALLHRHLRHKLLCFLSRLFSFHTLLHSETFIQTIHSSLLSAFYCTCCQSIYDLVAEDTLSQVPYRRHLKYMISHRSKPRHGLSHFTFVITQHMPHRRPVPGLCSESGRIQQVPFYLITAKHKYAFF